MLAATPHIGTARLPAFPRVRMFPVGRNLILYQPLEHEDGIELIRIIHGARDWQTLILDDLPCSSHRSGPLSLVDRQASRRAPPLCVSAPGIMTNRAGFGG